MELAPPVGVFTADKIFKPTNPGEPAKVAFCTAGIGITLALALSYSEKIEPVAALHVDRCALYGGPLIEQLEARTSLSVQKVFGKSREEVTEIIKEFSDDKKDFNIVLCGPIGFMKSAKQVLEKNACHKVFYEIFGTGNLK